MDIGGTKYGKEDVKKSLFEIVKEYDITAVQGIQDSKMELIGKFVQDLNTFVDPDVQTFGYSASERVGNKSQEQYAFIYRSSRVQLVENYTYSDANNEFNRDPFIGHFKTPDAAIEEFFLVVCRADNENVLAETNSLISVYDDAKTKFGIEEGMLLGDFSADCSFFNNDDKEKSSLRSDPKFLWLIGDDADTTVTTSDCAYDRVIVAGSYLQAESKNARVNDFQTKLGLTADQAKAVSGRFNVVVEIGGSTTTIVEPGTGESPNSGSGSGSGSGSWSGNMTGPGICLICII